jgi:ArsR family transcriptional regulator
MRRQDTARLEARATVIKALAHPTRLFLVEELARRERCVCELAAMVGADVSTVSRHLALLKTAGLVKTEKRGAQVVCRLRAPCVLRFLDCVGEVMESAAAQQWKAARAR